MIKDTPFRLIWGVWAITLYTAIIGLLLVYFNTRSNDQSKHFVKKDEHRIQVALSAPKQSTTTKQHASQSIKPKSKAKPKPKSPKPKAKAAKKPIEHIKKSAKPTKQVIKKKKIPKKAEKRVKKATVKTKSDNHTKIKKQKVNKLFSDIKSKKRESAKKTVQKIISPKKKPMSASQKISSSLKIQKSRDSGIENAYLAKVEEKLNGWPAQAEYAGEKAKVWLKIHPSGYFEFKVISLSNNPDFNEGLVAYLEQLKRFGFGPHKDSRPYEIEVEFVAKE